MHACIDSNTCIRSALLSAAVTNASASVDVILQHATSHKMIAKGRYTEQAPHTVRARASAYFHTAASAARSAVQRLQTAAESALQRNASSAASSSEQTESAHAESDQTQEIRRKAMASLTSAGATVKAAAHRLQVAADNVLRPSSGESQQAQTVSAENNADSTEVRNYCSLTQAVNACTLSLGISASHTGQHQQDSHAQACMLFYAVLHCFYQMQWWSDA